MNKNLKSLFDKFERLGYNRNEVINALVDFYDQREEAFG